MTKDFNILVDKLNAFRNKYYIFKVIEGSLVTLFLMVTIFTAFSVIEYFVYLNSEIRRIVFYGFIIFGLLMTVNYIILPFFKLVRIIKPIDIKSSSAFIQNHFSDIKDKLLNIIELAEISNDIYSLDIIKASIDQKISDINIFDFKKAVQFRNLRKVLIFFVLSSFISLTLFFINKSVYKETVIRFVHYNMDYIKPAPYSFELLNNKLSVKKGDTFKIQMKLEGDIVPDNVFINIEGNDYIMKALDTGLFEYEIASVINPVKFYFTDLKYKSDIFSLKLLPSPGINSFNVIINPPSYTGLSEQTISNAGDIIVPSGTHIKWLFSGIDIDTMYFNISDSTSFSVKRNDKNNFVFENNFYKTADYNVFIENYETGAELALSSSIEVIPDLFPEIKVVSVRDSVKMTRYFFKGIIGDDYGFTALNFHYNVDNSDSAIAIPFIKNLTDQDFYFSFDFSEIKAKSGTISYYFKVIDNDVINNYKSTTSNSYLYEVPTEIEIAQNENEQFKIIEDKLQQTKELTKDINNDLRNMKIKNMDTNITDWEKSQMVNEVISKQNKLENLYNEIKKGNQELNNYSNSYNQQNELIKEKQKQIEELLEEVFTDELKELLEEFNKLAHEFNSKKFNQLSNKIELSYEDLQQQLDRNLEMLKKMKVEQEIQNIIDKLQIIGNEEDIYHKELIENKDFDDILNKTNVHDQLIENLQQELKEALKINNELSKPVIFDEFNNEFGDINKSIDRSKELLNKKELKKSGSNIKETSELIKNTVFAMQQMLNYNRIEEHTENIQNLRQILGNLIYLSFSQEDVINDMEEISSNDPSLNTINLQQKRISDQNKIVKDSLYALAKRTPQINSLVNNELLNIEFNLDNAGTLLSDGNFNGAAINQRHVMTSFNNLSLMLNEALENLEKQLANAQPGDMQCENPNGGEGGMNMLKNASENIKKQLQKMIEQLKNGDNPLNDEQFGRLLMEHEMMQQMLREIMNSSGGNTRKALQQVDNMLEQNRKQLLDKNINSQMIARQNLITSQLLEAERAQLEQNYEDERERNLADDFHSNPAEFFEYYKEYNGTLEIIEKGSHKLTNFYNRKYKQYLNNVEK